MNTPLDAITLNENWVIFRFSYSVKHFEKQFDKTSKFSSALINGNQKIGNKTNRKFFKENVFGGFYFFKLSDDFSEINFIFYMELNPSKNKGFTVTNIKLRIKKILNTFVECVSPYELDETTKIILKSQVGRHFQRFGNQLKPPSRIKSLKA